MKRLLVLLVCVVVALWYMNFSAVEERNKPVLTTNRDQLLLAPELAAKLDKVRRIEISKEKSNGIVITLGDDKVWRVASHGMYPAKSSLIKSLLTRLSESILLEEKTSNPELWKHMKLDQKNAIRVKLIADEPNSPLLDVYLGEFRVNQGGTYVRHARDKQAWLASGEFTPEINHDYWLKQELFSLDERRLRYVKTTHIGAKGLIQTITQSRKSPLEDMDFVDIPKWAQHPNDYNGQMILAGFDDLIMTDVVQAKSVDGKERKVLTVDAETFDGLVMNISFVGEDENWAEISVHYDETKRWTPPKNAKAPKRTILPVKGYDSDVDKDSGGYDSLEGMDGYYMLPADIVKKEAKTLSQKTSGWAYLLPPYKYAMFARSPEMVYGANPTLAKDESDDNVDPANSVSDVVMPSFKDNKQAVQMLKGFGLKEVPKEDTTKLLKEQKEMKEIFKYIPPSRQPNIETKQADEKKKILKKSDAKK
jgi:hypothetical protein